VVARWKGKDESVYVVQQKAMVSIAMKCRKVAVREIEKQSESNNKSENYY